MMTPYPVHFSAERPERFARVQLFLRILAFVVLGMMSLSFGAILALLYLALPLYAATRIASLGSARDYLRADGGAIVKLLHWVASVCAWVGFVTDRLPARDASETVSFTVEETSPRATVGSAALRVLTGLPSAIVLAVLCWVGTLVWLWAALSTLVAERVGPGAFHYLAGLQRWSVRLLAYQACLVDAYPPFALAEAPPVLPEAKLAV
jgi:hypothetical protein